MKKIILFIFLFVAIAFTAQEKRIFEKEVLKISKKIEQITKSQKDSLRQKVIAIDKKLVKGEITKTTAATLKQETAMYYAKQIEIRVGKQENLLQLLVQEKTNGKIASAEENGLINEDVKTFKIGNKTFNFITDLDKEYEAAEQIRKEKRWRRNGKRNRATTSQFVFALGTNNVLQNHKLSSLNDSEYGFWQSHFYELGFTWKTRLTKDASQLYFKYGMSFLWNNLRLKDNQFHEKNENTTLVKTYAVNLSESRLRHVQMNFPMHLEWDFSKNKKFKDGFIHDRTNTSFRAGIGGFVGFKLGTRQYLEYKDNRGIEVKEKQFDNFNMNTVNYGLSTYVGYKSTSLYVKYDLNSLFKDTDIRNISMGLRLDLN
ncbi:MAG: hypothetical protein ACI9WV_002369 [Patiriisocius sp.]|jgi:hypothetical protein